MPRDFIVTPDGRHVTWPPRTAIGSRPTSSTTKRHARLLHAVVAPTPVCLSSRESGAQWSSTRSCAAAAPLPPMADPEERRRQAHLIGLLAFTSGSIDVVTLMVIGGSFTSVITGNLIFIGRAIGTQSLSPALHAIMAVAGYMAGVAVGSRLRQRLSRPGAAGALAVGGDPGAGGRMGPVGRSQRRLDLLRSRPAAGCRRRAAGRRALSLGMQGAAARSIKGNPSTTYMTGALTALVEALSTGGHRTIDASIAVGLLCSSRARPAARCSWCTPARPRCSPAGGPGRCRRHHAGAAPSGAAGGSGAARALHRITGAPEGAGWDHATVRDGDFKIFFLNRPLLRAKRS